MIRSPVIVVQLVHLQGPMKGEIQEFTEEIITIGRLPDSLLRFPKDLGIISRKHAEITRDGNRFRLVDFSINGTFVNGKRVKEEVLLKNGDVLTFAEGGPKVSFLMVIKEGGRDAEPVPIPKPKEASSPVVQRTPGGLKPELPKALPHGQEIPVQTVNVPLICQYGPTLRSFKQLPVTVGKHPSCQLTIDHPAILDMHAQIFYGQNQYWIKDLTGRNLVRINGEPVGSQTPLNASDVLALSPEGPFFRFLGEGRLAEEMQDAAVPGEPEGKDDESQLHRQELNGKKDDQGKKPFLKRFIP